MFGARPRETRGRRPPIQTLTRPLGPPNPLRPPIPTRDRPRIQPIIRSVAGTLNRDQARRFYDRIGARQDSQGFYEDPPLDDLKSNADFDQARRVAEFGCGTGKFALDLFKNHLPADARYLGFELSPVMADLARRRLGPYSERAAVVLTDGRPILPVADQSLDRVVSNYVLDLLSETDIRAFLFDARRALRPDGRLCLTGLGRGERGLSRFTAWAWERVHRFRPAWVGGCRPLDMRPFLPKDRWRILHCQTVVAFQIPSQTLVAVPLY